MRRSSIGGRRRHGISNAHAFAVGRSTGVNINGSAMGAHGAALHRSSQRRRRHSTIHKSHTSSMHRRSSTMHTGNINTTNTVNMNHINEASKGIMKVVGIIIATYILLFIIIMIAIIFMIVSFK